MNNWFDTGFECTFNTNIDIYIGTKDFNLSILLLAKSFADKIVLKVRFILCARFFMNYLTYLSASQNLI